MSAKHRQAARKTSRVFRCYTRLLLFVLAEYASDGENYKYPNGKIIKFGWLAVPASRLMSDMGIHRRMTLWKCFQRLIDKKVVKRVKAKMGDPWQTFLDIDELNKLASQVNGKTVPGGNVTAGHSVANSEREKTAIEIRAKIKDRTRQFHECKNSAEKKRIADEVALLRDKLSYALETRSVDEIEKFLNAPVH